MNTLTPTTAHKAYDALAQIMRAAIANREFVYNLPVRPTASSRDRRAALLVHGRGGLDGRLHRASFRALVLLGAYGGLRFGELAGLRRGRVDVLRSRVSVRETLVDVNGELSFGEPKTKRSRRDVPLPRTITRELEAHLERFTRTERDALVLAGPKGAQLRPAGFLRCWWLPATDAARLQGLRFHNLRHSFVSIWQDAGPTCSMSHGAPATRAWPSPWIATATLYEDRSDELVYGNKRPRPGQ